MTQTKTCLQAILIICITLLSSCKSQELSPKDLIKSNEISEAVTVHKYIFKPTSATPASYRMIDLQPGYYLEISGDSIIADLPYYGRSYTAPIDPTEIGIKFISTNSEYNIKEKKDGWDVTIKPKDTNKNLELYLSIGKTGYSSLRVFDTNRQNISYYGNVESTIKK